MFHFLLREYPSVQLFLGVCVRFMQNPNVFFSYFNGIISDYCTFPPDLKKIEMLNSRLKCQTQRQESPCYKNDQEFTISLVSQVTTSSYSLYQITHSEKRVFLIAGIVNRSFHHKKIFQCLGQVSLVLPTMFSCKHPKLTHD